MKDVIKRLLVLIVFFVILLGIPYIYGVEFLVASIILGLISAYYLDKSEVF